MAAPEQNWGREKRYQEQMNRTSFKTEATIALSKGFITAGIFWVFVQENFHLNRDQIGLIGLVGGSLYFITRIANDWNRLDALNEKEKGEALHDLVTNTSEWKLRTLDTFLSTISPLYALNMTWTNIQTRSFGKK